MSGQFKYRDLVWARMKGYKPWPGCISQTSKTKKGCQWVYFFGSSNFGWIENESIKPYEEFKDKLSTTTKAAQFKLALQQIEDYIEKKKADPTYELDVPEVKEPEESSKNTSPKKPRKSLKRPSETSDKPKSAKKVKKTVSAEADENGSQTSSKADESFADLETSLPRYRVESPDLDKVLKNKDILATPFTIGFIGAGAMGSGMMKNLITSGHKINIYDRSSSKCEEVKSQAEIHKLSALVTIQKVPGDVIKHSDLTFSCVSDTQAAQKVLFDEFGILNHNENLKGKGYIEMTSISPETSADFAEVITNKGGRYLEVQLLSGKKEAEEGNLVVVAAGDRILFDDCLTCFKAIGKYTYFLGQVGLAQKMNAILKTIQSVSLVGLSEAIIFAERSKLDMDVWKEIFAETTIASSFLKGKVDRILSRDFQNPDQTIQCMQRDLQTCLECSNQLKQALPMTATANEMLKQVRKLGYDGQDCSCVFLKNRI